MGVALIAERAVVGPGDSESVASFPTHRRAPAHGSNAGTAVLVVNAGPLLIALLGATFLGEGLSTRLVVGCLIAFLGTSVVVATSADLNSLGGSRLGVLLCLGATIAYAVAATVQRRALMTAPSAWVNLGGAVAATIACLAFLPTLTNELVASGSTKVLWLVYLGIGPTAFGFTGWWAYALSRGSAGRTASLNYLIPVVAIVLGSMLLGEAPGPAALLGGVLSVGGVALARSRSRRDPAQTGDPATEARRDRAQAS